jgi:hypothetical protein
MVTAATQAMSCSPWSSLEDSEDPYDPSRKLALASERPTDDKLELYGQRVATIPSIEWKGTSVPLAQSVQVQLPIQIRNLGAATSGRRSRGVSQEIQDHALQTVITPPRTLRSAQQFFAVPTNSVTRVCIRAFRLH